MKKDEVNHIIANEIMGWETEIAGKTYKKNGDYRDCPNWFGDYNDAMNLWNMIDSPATIMYKDHGGYKCLVEEYGGGGFSSGYKKTAQEAIYTIVLKIHGYLSDEDEFHSDVIN